MYIYHFSPVIGIVAGEPETKSADASDLNDVVMWWLCWTLTKVKLLILARSIQLYIWKYSQWSEVKDSSVSRSRLVSGFTGRDCRWNFFFYMNKRLPLCLAGSASWLSDCLDTSHRRSTEECGFTDVAFFVRSTAALGCTLAYSSMLTHLCMSECCVLPDARVGIFLCWGGGAAAFSVCNKGSSKAATATEGGG